MMNWSLHTFTLTVKLLRQEIAEAMFRSSSDPAALPIEAEKSRIVANLEAVSRECAKLGLDSADKRLGRLFTNLRIGTLTYAALLREFMTFHEAIEDDINTEYFYHYRHDRGILLLRVSGDWAATIAKFESAKEEIEAGVDCYALEHHTACVFHMMRVAEIGMRSLARERQVSFPKHPIEWADWQNIIDRIEKSVRTLGPSMPRGPIKDAALAFYSGAVGQLHGFKDTFRNVTMHVRRRYDELDALRSISQVRDFMNGLSAKIGEKTRRPIRKWP